MISFEQSGNFDNIEKYLNRMLKNNIYKVLEKYAKQGVEALKQNTPKDTGHTANSWGYEIEIKHDTYTIYWTNTNVQNGVNIALILSTGHGTKNGGYVAGRNYIDPSILPVFNDIAEACWREVTR